MVGDVHLILVNGSGEVLFGQRHNTGYEDGAWHLPSGHLEAGESVLAALIREAAEETGIVIGDRDVEFAHIMHNSSSGGRAAFFFKVQHWTGTPLNLEPGKCKDLRWFPAAELPDRMIEYCRTSISGGSSDMSASLISTGKRTGAPGALIAEDGGDESSPRRTSEPLWPPPWRRTREPLPETQGTLRCQNS